MSARGESLEATNQDFTFKTFQKFMNCRGFWMKFWLLTQSAIFLHTYLTCSECQNTNSKLPELLAVRPHENSDFAQNFSNSYLVFAQFSMYLQFCWITYDENEITLWLEIKKIIEAKNCLFCQGGFSGEEILLAF